MKTCKVLIIGESAVGKTSLLRKILGEPLIEKLSPTVGVEFSSYVTNNLKLQLWDTAGQEKFRSVTRAYFRNAAGALLLFDITNESTFASLDEWINTFRQLAYPNAPLLIVGNKVDLENHREITVQAAEAFAKRYDAEYIETSAINGDNAEQAFSRLAQEILRRSEKGTLVISNFEGVPSQNTNQAIAPYQVQPPPKKSCC